MIEELNNIDSAIFLFLNHLHNSFLDVIMYWSSNKWIWIPFYAFLAFFIYRKYGNRVFLVMLFIGLLITISDQVSSTLIKNTVMRLRPCHDASFTGEIHLVNGYCGGNYGFVSSHASNAAALTTFIIFLFRRKYKRVKWALISWAVLVSYSRIYLGAHFPGDVIGGALLGFILGVATIKTMRYVERHYLPRYSRVNRHHSKNNH